MHTSLLVNQCIGITRINGAIGVIITIPGNTLTALIQAYIADRTDIAIITLFTRIRVDAIPRIRVTEICGTDIVIIAGLYLNDADAILAGIIGTQIPIIAFALVVGRIHTISHVIRIIRGHIFGITGIIGAWVVVIAQGLGRSAFAAGLLTDVVERT